MSYKVTQLHKSSIVASSGGYRYRELSRVLSAGLYDKNDKLIVSWDTLVNTYGMKCSVDYTSSQATSAAPGLPSAIISRFGIAYNEVKLIISDNVHYLGDYTFYNCYGLTSVVIPSSVVRLGYTVFARSDLKSVVIPVSVTTIWIGAFYRCYNLTDVYYTGSKEEWNAITIRGNNDPLTNATIHYNYTG